MKKLILLISFVLIIFSLLAQQNQLTYKNSTDPNDLLQKVLDEMDQTKSYFTAPMNIFVDTAFIETEAGIEKITYTHHSTGNIESRLTQKWQFYSWTNNDLIVFTYDEQGNMLTYLDQSWVDDKWTNQINSTTSYDDNGNRIKELVQIWDNGTWENHNMSIYTYDAKGSSWNTWVSLDWENEIWENDLRVSVTHNSNGDWLSALVERWENNSWQNDVLQTFTYDQYGYRETYEFQIWENEAWVNNDLITETHDEYGNRLTQIQQQWENDIWVNHALSTYTYDVKDNNLTQLRQIWENDAWKNYTLFTNTFDENDNKIIEMSQYWESDNWINNYKANYIFSPNQINAEVLEWDGINWIDSENSIMLDIIVNGDPIFENYFYYGIALELYYRDPTSIEDLAVSGKKPPVHCYPNPASNELTLELIHDWQNTPLQIDLFNQTGQKIKSFEFSESSGTESLHLGVDELPGGLYMLQLTNGNNVVSQKIIISK